MGKTLGGGSDGEGFHVQHDGRIGSLSGFYFVDALGHPIDVCPDCYAQRDCTIPVMLSFGGPRTYFRDPVTKERLRDAPQESVRICLACGWREDQ